MDKKLHISHFTDPLCFWCYAMEPEMRKIRVLLGDQLDYRIVMGVLSSDIREIIGFDEEADLRYEFFRNMMVDHLIQAAKAVGMPFAGEALFSNDPEDMVSLPLSMAYSAMKMIDDDIAEAYLRRMRECVFAEGRSLVDVEDQVELAAEFPIDVEEFRANLDNGAAAVLQASLEECRMYSVSAFPTLLMEYEGQRFLLSGYHTYEEFKQVIGRLTDGEISLSDAEYSLSAAEEYMERFGKATAREIQTMFSLNDAQLANVMMDLVSTGRYKTQRCATSYFIASVEAASETAGEAVDPSL